MKKCNFILFFILTLSFSFLYSDYAKLPSNNTSPLSNIKGKKPDKNKPGKVKPKKNEEAKPKAKDLPAKEILNQDLIKFYNNHKCTGGRNNLVPLLNYFV